MRTRDASRTLAAALSAAALLLVVPAIASAEMYVVNTTADPTPQQNPSCVGTCTLRDALFLAGNTDSISVPAGTYVLVQGELSLAGDTLIGAGARSTIIDGNSQDLVMSATDSGGTASTISGVTIRGGLSAQAGGGIDMDGIVAINNSHIVGNTALSGGGIYLSGGGGAVLTMVGSTVAGNTASNSSGTHGGGIGTNGEGHTITLINSTVTGNVARDAGANSALGGGIYSGINSTLTLSNVTVAGNEAAGGGGGVYVATGAPTTLTNTIVAENVGSACAGQVAAIPASSHHNLISDGTCMLTGPGNLQGVGALIGGLTNNGGPTDTRALGATSLAVNAGSGCPATDQRGVARPQQGTCDIGAFEYVPPIPPPPPPPPPANEQLPPPVAGKSVNVLPKSGTVRIRRPGASRFSRLTEGQQVPVGTTVDTLKGRVTLVAAADKLGKTATADFYDGIFKISQGKGSRPITTLTLVEKLSCPKKAGSAIAAAKKKKRRLWGDGSGRFRTKGKHSAATVVGTKWLVEDRCKSTLTRVVRGRVSVRDFVKKKTIIVRKGKRYIARARQR